MSSATRELGDDLLVDEPRNRRILAVALRLAEHGGFAAVRLRDVAEQADVALRTLYRRFPSKDDLLFAVLVGEMVRVEERWAERPARGATSVERVRDLFSVLTDFLCARPNLGRAIIRALVVGSPRLSEQVATFHGRINAMIVEAIGGGASIPINDPRHPHLRLGAMLQHVWFSSLISWSSGSNDSVTIVETVSDAASLVLEPPRMSL